MSNCLIHYFLSESYFFILPSCLEKLEWIRMILIYPFVKMRLFKSFAKQYAKQSEKQFETIETIKKKKVGTSNCWKYFTKIEVDKDGKERVKCIGCTKVLLCGGRKYGTSHLNHRAIKCDKYQTEDIGQMMLEINGKLTEKKIDQGVYCQLLCEAIVEPNLPYNFVEYYGIRKWIRLCLDRVMVSRNNIKFDIGKIYMKEKIILKDLLLPIPNRICLTFDLWTSINIEGFISLTANFVDASWMLKSKILNFCHMPPPHIGFELSKKIYELLQD